MNKVNLHRSDFTNYFEMDTRWKDMDSLGHINNSVFLTYFESGRINLLKKWKFEYPPFIMASVKLDYLKQLSHPAKLSIGNKVSRLGNTSFDILSTLFANDEDTPTATAVITLVCFDYEEQLSTPVPKIIRNSFEG